MVGYNELSKLNVFSLTDVEKIIQNEKSAHSLVLRLISKGMVKKIRKNIYSCVNPATGGIIATRFHIGSAINETAYISHHSAFEYHGMANQVFYEIYVSSDIRFNDFEFDGVKYKYISSKVRAGVIESKNTEGVKVTDLERTVIDSIKDFEKIGGFEELLNCLSSIHYLNEEKLIKYLDQYNIKGLYQKTGFLLEHYMTEMQLSNDFIDYCMRKVGKSTRYLLKDNTNDITYLSKWKLIIPNGLFDITEHGGGELV